MWNNLCGFLKLAPRTDDRQFILSEGALTLEPTLPFILCMPLLPKLKLLIYPGIASCISFNHWKSAYKK